MGIIENFKDVLKLADAANNLDLYKKLAELQNSVLSLQEENRELKEHLAKRDEHDATQKNLKHDGERYWLEKDGKKDGPFCHTCWDRDNKLVRMRKYEKARGGYDFMCDFCGRHRNRPANG